MLLRLDLLASHKFLFNRSSLTRLNEDVLLCIIEVLCLASRWDDLKAFSLTCRAIRLVCAPVIFARFENLRCPLTVPMHFDLFIPTGTRQHVVYVLVFVSQTVD